MRRGCAEACCPEQGTAPARRHRDTGFTLVEAVVTMTLLALVVVPTLGAVRGSIRASATNRELAHVETALINAAEAVSGATVSCGDDDYRRHIVEALQALSGDVRLERVVVEHASPVAVDGGDDYVWYSEPCPAGTPRFDLVQRIRVAVSGRDGDIRRELHVLKTNV